MPRKQPKQSTGSIDLAKARESIMGAGTVVEQKITSTLEKNFMPYAMSVILSRAIPEIDGFKPSHRKLLFTMYKMNLLGSTRTKCANIVGQTMRLNPHGDVAIYDTLVRLSRGYEALLHPFVDSKGNFGKFYSRDMAWAASRYTEAKLEPLAAELFRDIEKDTVDFADNYDSTMREPTLLPITFPSVLVNANTGIAVGMASSICPFNLGEVCQTAIDYIRDNEHNIIETLKAPDFPGGGRVIYNREQFEQIYKTGRGSFKVRAVYEYDKPNNCIDIFQIPPTTTAEAIIEKIIELIKAGKIREISDIRDEIGLNGLKITIDLKRGVDPDMLMARLFRATPLEDSFSCNFNILVGGSPRVMGIREILDEWLAFRVLCVKRRVYFDLSRQKEKLHLLKGLAKILLDIDKAVKIVRETDEEALVVPNLMIGFGIDEIQAEYVAEIKLRHLNREYILKRTEDIEKLERSIEELSAILESKSKVRSIIISELKDIIKKYASPRKTELAYIEDEGTFEPEKEVPDYPVNLFFTAHGYFKKITPQSLRMSGEQKLKESDTVSQIVETGNNRDLLFFSDKCQVYKAKANDFEDTKASLFGEYIPRALGMDEGENAVYMAVTGDYGGYMLFFFRDGKVAKVDMNSYATKTNRRKLLRAYSDKSPLIAAFYTEADRDFLLRSSGGKMLILNSGAINSKTTKDTAGVAVMTQRKGHGLLEAKPFEEDMLTKPHRYRTRSLPAAGSLPLPEDMGEQLEIK